jgi:CubicO group peptidase (beta-lactamase class C family)
MQRMDLPSSTARRRTRASRGRRLLFRFSCFAGVVAVFFLASVRPIPAAAWSFVPFQVSTGHPTRSSGLPAALRNADTTIARMTRQKLFSGAVLVARNGSLLLGKGYGMADRKLHVSNTAQTQFRIGTTTNQFTAMAILQLQAAGKLHVRDRVCAYVPRCPRAWRLMTIHQLLTHTSGMQDFAARPLPAGPTSPSQVLAAAEATPLIARPGSVWSYSNLGYDVLGYIIEKTGQRSYGSYLQTHIFGPAGMSSSAYFLARKPTRLAVGYADAYSISHHVDMSGAFASAGVYSTVGDLYRWDQALSTPAVAPLRVVAEMFTPYVTVCRNNCPLPPDAAESCYRTGVAQDGYGYGWGVLRLARSHHRLFCAVGGFSTGQSYNGRYPDDRVTVVVLTNQDDVDIARVVALLERPGLRKNKYPTRTGIIICCSRGCNSAQTGSHQAGRTRRSPDEILSSLRPCPLPRRSAGRHGDRHVAAAPRQPLPRRRCHYIPSHRVESEHGLFVGVLL